MKSYQLKSLLLFFVFLLTTLVAYTLEPSESQSEPQPQVQVVKNTQDDLPDPAM